MKSLLLYACLPLVGLLPASFSFAQGSLTPPGAPAATMKTLDQLDAKLETRIAVNATNTPGSANAQFVISSPGSYYLPASFTAGTGRTGITITADDVTLDLRGHIVTGVAGALDGIRFLSRLRVRIQNGTVRSFPGAGLNGGSSEGAVIENIVVEGCSSTAVFVGLNARLTDCHARNNTGAASLGIQTNNGAILLRCHGIGNGGAGIAAGAESTVRDSVARSNGGDGFLVSTACVVTHCVSSDNTGAGFTSAGVGLVVDHCISRDNGGFGIAIGTDGLIAHCTTNANTGGGIQGGSGTTILSNVCASHSATATTPGIRLTGSGGRVEGNTCRSNGRGFESTTGPNLFVRNLARANTTNYSLSGTGAGVFVTEAQIATNTDPHANFDF